MDEGEIILDGQKVTFRDSKHALENGVAMVHQELNQALQRSSYGKYVARTLYFMKVIYQD